MNYTYAQTANVNERKQVFGSAHLGDGANFLMCDGSVHFIRQSVDVVTYVRLSVRNDGRVVDLPW
jgi:prepilin-type processing-associated H-X9-DG protein